MASSNYYNRLLRIILGFITSMASGVLLTWSYYRQPLMDLFPTWSTSDLSLIFSIHNIVVAITMAGSSFILKKLSTRSAYFISALCFAVGLCGYYFLPADNPGAAYVLAFLFYAIIAPLGCGISCLLNYSIYPAWYPERSGFISGLMIMGFNTCPLVMGAIAGAVIPDLGIKAAFLITGIIICCATLLSMPYGEYPTEKHILPPAPVREENTSGQDYTTGEMIKTSGFWIIFVYHTLIFAVGLIVADHAAGIAAAFGAAALFGLLFAPAKGISCFVIGWIMDKVSTFGAMLIIDILVIGSSLLLILAAGTSSTILILIGLILLGFGIGGVSTIKATAIRFFYGSRNYQQNYGITNINIAFSAAIVFVAGKIIEAMNGSYNGIFIMICIIGLLALLCTFCLKLYMKKTAAKNK